MWLFAPHAFLLVIFAAVAIVAAWFGFWAFAQGHFATKPFGVLAVFVAETLVVGTRPSAATHSGRIVSPGLCRELCERVDDMGKPTWRADGSTWTNAALMAKES